MSKAKIHYYDIGDYLSREDKLRIIKQFRSVENIPWTILEPNEHGDWINHRNEMFKDFIPLGDKDDKKNKRTFFVPIYARGIGTSRDSWAYNYSKKVMLDSMKKSNDFFNNQRILYAQAKKNNSLLRVEDFIDTDPFKISWSRTYRNDIEKNRVHVFDLKYATIGIYRPFSKMNLYFDKAVLNDVGPIFNMFPTSRHKNLVICVSGLGGNKENSAYISNCIVDLNCLDAGTQCFPLYWYEEEQQTYQTGGMDNMFESPESSYIQREGITDWILTAARKQYGYKVTKEDIFYYVYGLLHSPDYRTTFATDLKKSLPRLPLVEKADDFWAFSKAGRELADLHLNYETIEPYRKCIISFAPLTNKGDKMDYHVEKMRFGKIDSKTSDKSVIHYNNAITITDIPAEAYEYVVNGKSAIEWIMERYAITTDKKSGITNDPNDWAREHNDEKYILNLLLRVINVSVQTVEIVKELPKLKFE